MRALLAVLLLAACHGASTPAPQPATPPALKAWSETTFDANVQAKLGQHFNGAAVTKLEGDDDGYRVSTFEVRFAKAHADCRADWSACGAAVDHTIAALDEISHPGAIQRTQLRVVLRANEKIAHAKARAKVTTQPFSSDAQWLLAADLPNTIRYDVGVEDLGLSSDEAWKIATENTKPANPVTATTTGILIYQDVYAPSALRFPELLVAAVRSANPNASGNLLAVCPEENIVLYTMGGAHEAAALRQAAENGAKDSEIPLSTKVMEWSAGNWHEAH